MRRLYLQIYLAFVGILILFGTLIMLTWFLIPPRGPDLILFEEVAALAGEILPASDEPIEKLHGTIERIGSKFPADIAVHDADGKLLASLGDRLPPQNPNYKRSGWIQGHRTGPAAAFLLPDGRWMVVRHAGRSGGNVLSVLALLAGAIAVGAYPIARRITRRVERLQTRVDDLGAGDLSERVEVEGNDEVASLARSFNVAADRVERLVNTQRHTLISASHELRSPLARIRIAVELLGDDHCPDVRARITKDIAELDGFIEELLLASRLDTMGHLEQTEAVDLLTLLAEEGARVEAMVTGEPVCILGDARMLRRLIRNLLENAYRYADGSPVEASVAPLERGGSGARLRVEDRGPGVPVEERENIFKPFYRPPGMRETADGGVGLGLALVRQIAHRHAGEARCLPRKGGGTCFEVTLWATVPPAP